MAEGSTAFSCLWSKDPPTKKRKRWNDGTVKLMDNKDGSGGALVMVFDEFGIRIASERCKMSSIEKDSEIEVGRLSLQVLEALEIVDIADENNVSGVEKVMRSGNDVITPVKNDVGLEPIGDRFPNSGTPLRSAMKANEASFHGLHRTECNNNMIKPSVQRTANVLPTYPPTTSSVARKEDHPPFRKSTFPHPSSQSIMQYQVATPPCSIKRPAGKFSHSIIPGGVATAPTTKKNRSGYVLPRSLTKQHCNPEGPTVGTSASSLDPTDLILEEGPPLALSLGTSLAKHLKKHQRTGVKVRIESLALFA